MDLARVLIVGTVKEANSLNSYNVKLVKRLNNLGVVHIVANKFQTLIARSIDLPHSFFIFVK
jgi:hypothetical protein